jgi:hypothetical protein
MSAVGPRLRKWVLWGSLVILVLLGIALLFPNPELVPHRIAAHERSAVVHLRTLFEEQQKFRAEHNGSFADALNQLPDSTPGDRAYVYSLKVTARDLKGRVSKYVATASPSSPGKTGTRFFSVDEQGTLHVELMRPVDPGSPVLE